MNELPWADLTGWGILFALAGIATKSLWPLLVERIKAGTVLIQTATTSIQQSAAAIDKLATNERYSRKALSLALDEIYRLLPDEKQRELRGSFDEIRRLLSDER